MVSGSKTEMTLIVVLLVGLVGLSVVASDCDYTKHHEASTKTGDAEITPLKNKRYTANDEYYEYDIGICSSPVLGDPTSDVGVLQINKTNRSATKIVGRISDADIIGGTDWVMLTYNNGDKYNSHCGNEPRRAKIMFVCDPAAADPSYLMPTVAEEQNEKSEDCYYLFEINTAAVCKNKPAVNGLSVGSILLIVFVSVLAFYLVAGVLYKRFFLHAKGREQIPNISFWEDFGNLQADGCNLVCRCGGGSQKPREYKGIGDEQLDDRDLSPDDGLLPM